MSGGGIRAYTKRPLVHIASWSDAVSWSIFESSSDKAGQYSQYAGMHSCQHTEGMNAYFATIDSKLSINDNLLNEAPILFSTTVWLRLWYCFEYYILLVTAGDDDKERLHNEEGDGNEKNDNGFAKL